MADRFIPLSVDYDFAHFKIYHGRELETDPTPLQRRLRDAFNFHPNRRIFVYNSNKPKPPPPPPPSSLSLSPLGLRPKRAVKPPRHIPSKADKTLDLPDMVHDVYRNILEWSPRSSVLAVALGSTVHLWDHSRSQPSELVTFGEEKGVVTSLSWSPDGQRIAVGLLGSEVEVWDVPSASLLRACHGTGVGVASLAWNSAHVLTSGGKDGRIVDTDITVGDHDGVLLSREGHRKDVCGLRWSPTGRLLASGGRDRMVRIWDRRFSRSSRPLFSLRDHTSSVKALDWCTFHDDLLASGGGGGDGCIRFWNSKTGACLQSVDTGSPVTALVWSRHEKEIMSSHGVLVDNMALWKYPSLVKMGTLGGHRSDEQAKVLNIAQSADGCTVASLSSDERLRFWRMHQLFSGANQFYLSNSS